MGERAAYSRVYWEIRGDERLASVYGSDAALGAWLRLLVSADMAWPACAELPGGISRSTLKTLVDAGIIELFPGRLYRFHGLDAERKRRSRAPERTPDGAPDGPHDGGNRGTSWSPTGNQLVTSRPLAYARAPRLVSSSSSSLSGEGVQGEGLPSVTEPVASAWEDATGRTLLGSGAFAAEYIDDACRRHGGEPVRAAIESCRRGFTTVPATAPLAVAVRALLDPLVPVKLAADVADLEAAGRARAEAAARRRTEASQRQLHGYGGHTGQPSPRCPLCAAGEAVQ